MINYIKRMLMGTGKPTPQPITKSRVIRNRIGRHLAQVYIRGRWCDIDHALIESTHTDFHYSLLGTFVLMSEEEAIARIDRYWSNRETAGVVYEA